MLNFFRKNQRIFFIIITVVICISFTFFGASNSLSEPSEVPDRVITKGVDGSNLMQRDLATVCRLISSSPLDRNAWQQGKIPNLLNDSVIEKDLLSTGMGMMLARRYFEELKPDFEKRLVRIKSYRPYAHPQYPQISAVAIWNRFMPSLSQHFALLKTKSDQFTVETLGILFQLYLDQTMLPPDMVKQILVYQLNQQALTPDPLLSHTDLSLFGFHSLEDWFGPRFIELAGQFMMNAALLAQDKGYEISNEAIRSDLYQNIVNGYREISRQEQIKAEDVESYYQNELRHLGVDERQLLASWKNVMLFRRLFQDIGNSVFLDPLAYQQFHQYTRDALKVDLYELPSYLQLSDLLDVFKLQLYLEAVSFDYPRQRTQLSLPRQLLALDTIEKKAPELIEQQFEIEYAEVRKEDLTRNISLKQTWEWEVQDASWEALKKQFSELAASKAQSAQDRFAALDALDSAVRLKVDAFAQNQMISQHPEQIMAALEVATPRTASLGLRASGGSTPFTRIKDQRKLMELLRAAPIKGEIATVETQTIQNRLNAYSEDQQTFYRIHVLDRSPDRVALTFAKAKSDGTLEKMLEKRLDAAYPEVRRKQPSLFQNTDGSWKPLRDVKEQVGRIVFADLLKATEDSYRSLTGELPGKVGELPSTFYAQYRLHAFVSDLKAEVEQHPEDARWMRFDAIAEPTVDNQWKLIKTSRTVERNSDFSFAKEQMFAVPVNGWSNVEIGQAGSLAFYRVTEKEVVADITAQEVEQGQHLLSLDAQRNFMVDLLNQIHEKNAIDLTAGDQL